MQSLDDVPEQMDEQSDDCPEQALFVKQQNSVLIKTMQKLPIKQKLVVELKFFQQCTFDDIAQQLGISTNTAKSQLYSALDKLKLYLEAEALEQNFNTSEVDHV